MFLHEKVFFFCVRMVRKGYEQEEKILFRQKKAGKIIGLLFWGVFFGIILWETRLQAASATVYLSSDKETYAVGETASVTMTVNSSAGVSLVEAGLFYDNTCIYFKKGNRYVKEEGGVISVSDHSAGGGDTRTYKMKFKASEEGSCELMLAAAARVCGPDGAEMSVSANRLTIKVSGILEKEENTFLSSLDPSEGTLVPEFHRDITRYDLSVPEETESILFNAVPEDSSSFVQVTGNLELRDGKNHVNISVTGKNGGKKNYLVVIHRAAASEELVSDAKNAKEKKKTGKDGNKNKEGKEKEKSGEFQVDTDEKGGAWMKLGGDYQIMECPEEDKIPEGYIKTQVILDGVSVPAYTQADNLENEFLLVYASHDGEESFYYYDRMEKTLQRYTGAAFLHSGRTTVVQDKDTYDEKISDVRIVILVLAAVIFLLLIAIIMLVLRLKGSKEEL